jgi:hypothetical protein
MSNTEKIQNKVHLAKRIDVVFDIYKKDFKL